MWCKAPLRALAVMLLFLLVGVPSVWAQTLPPVGQWASVPNTRAIDAMAVADFYSGPTPFNPISLFAYSGGDLVQLGGVWGFVLTGAGHAASPDNETIFVPLDGSGPRQLQGPYTSPDGIYKYDVPFTEYKPSGIWTDARKSVHTYSSFLAIEKGGQPFLFLANGSTYTGAGGGSNRTRLFDLAQTRAQAMARPDLGWQRMTDAPFPSVASASGWDPVQKRVVHRGARFIGAYYPETDTWENWNILPAATLCCDFSASVAMDITGRKMYVLGDGLAEMYDLDTKAYTNLAGQPWAARFLIRGIEGPGVAWHERTRQIVAWMVGIDGNALDVINPATGTRTTVPMGGVTVSTPPSAGTYGRFRLLPGTNTVALVNSVFETAYLGTVPFDGTPVPPPVPPATVATLTALPASITSGQSALLTLFTPTLDYHNVFINGVRPAGVTTGTTTTWTLSVSPTVTTLYQATATNSTGTPYVMPSATVTVTAPPPPGFAIGASVYVTAGVSLNVRPVPRIPSVPMGVQLKNALGVIVDGPVGDLSTGPVKCTGLWWQITYAVSPSGWSCETFLALVPTPPAPPPPPPLPPSAGVIPLPAGQPIPPRQWVERPMPGRGQAFMGGDGGKHGRAFYHPGLTGLVFAGGDWHSSMETALGLDGNGEGSEIWTLNVLADRWTLLRPLCVPGETQPGRPDSVGWAYDSKRNRGLMAPGFYFITQPPPGPGGWVSPCGALEGLGGYAFDFGTKKFSGPDAAAGMPPPPNGWGGDGGASFATYDPAADEFVRVRGRTLERLNLASKVWRTQGIGGSATWNPNSNRSQLVIDVAGRSVYFLDRDGDRGGFAEGRVWPVTPPALVRVSLLDGSVMSYPLPSQYTRPYDGSQDIYLAFDPGNRLVLVPNNVGMGESPIRGLGIFNVDLVTWTWEATPGAVWGSVWAFDVTAGALVGIGKRQWPTAYYVYKVR